MRFYIIKYFDINALRRKLQNVACRWQRCLVDHPSSVWSTLWLHKIKVIPDYFTHCQLVFFFSIATSEASNTRASHALGNIWAHRTASVILCLNSSRKFIFTWASCLGWCKDRSNESPTRYGDEFCIPLIMSNGVCKAFFKSYGIRRNSIRSNGVQTAAFGMSHFTIGGFP